jgi:hypothetical protein
MTTFLCKYVSKLSKVVPVSKYHAMRTYGEVEV